MPRIMEMKEIDGAMWARLDLTKEQSPVHLYTDAEVVALREAERNDALEEAAEAAENAWRYEMATAEQYKAKGREDQEALFNSGATVAKTIQSSIRKLKS